MTTPTEALDLLARYRTARVLATSDVHVAAALCRLSGDHRPAVVLAAALAARAPRLAHVCADLAHVVTGDHDADSELIATLHWPEPGELVEILTESPLVVGPDAPLVLEGTRLYLRRYHDYELRVADELRHRAAVSLPKLTADPDVVGALLTGDGSDLQRQAVDAALTRAVTVLVGGPGTGKTTTVAAALATLAITAPTLRLALAAPTGKAAARLGEAVRDAARRLPPASAALLARAEASTVHRLLGVRGGSDGSFFHHRGRPLPHDVVIVDETSMVSLPLMAKLLDALRPEARLILVGDPDQLASVEAGTVLGDLASAPELAAHVSTLEVSRRFPPGSPIDRLARAVRAGDADAALEVLASTSDTVRWIDRPAPVDDVVSSVMDLARPPTLSMIDQAVAGDVQGALHALESFRILCAHREGPVGVRRWNRLIEREITAAGRRADGWYAGRPVLVTANDYVNHLFNGDVGVVVATPTRPMVAFPEQGTARLLAPARLQTAETIHAATIHKSQGSEFDHVVVLLPPAESPLSSRELVYTGITRARRRVTVVGDEAAVRTALARKVARPGGLRAALRPG